MCFTLCFVYFIWWTLLWAFSTNTDLLIVFFFFQSQLEEKVRIFERKVESYKKLTQNLESTEEYIRVMLIWRLFADHREQKVMTKFPLYRTAAHTGTCLCYFHAESGQGGGEADPAGVWEAPRCTAQRTTSAPKWTGSRGGAEDCCCTKSHWNHEGGHQGSWEAHRVCEERDGQRRPAAPTGGKRTLLSVEQQRSFKRLYSVIRIALVCVSEFPGIEKKVSSLSRQHAIVYILKQHTTWLSLRSLQKANIPDKVICCCLS